MAEHHDDLIARILADQGITPDPRADSHAEPFTLRLSDPIGYRRDMVNRAFARLTRGAHQGAHVTHPDVAAWVSDNLRDPQSAPALVIIGPPGVGKTYEAIGALRAIAVHHADRNRTCEWHMIAHADLNSALRPKSDNSHEWVLERYAQAPYLIFDDLGAGYLTEYAREGALRLIDDRYRAGRTTLYTTNLDPDGLQVALGHRAASRLLEHRHHVVIYDGPDRRLTPA